MAKKVTEKRDIFERFIPLIGAGIFFGGLLFLLVSAFVPLNNNYSQAAMLTPWYMKAIGLVLLAASVTIGVMLNKSRIEGTKVIYLLMVVLCLFAYLFFIGFNSYSL